MNCIIINKSFSFFFCFFPFLLFLFLFVSLEDKNKIYYKIITPIYNPLVTAIFSSDNIYIRYLFRGYFHNCNIMMDLSTTQYFNSRYYIRIMSIDWKAKEKVHDIFSVILSKLCYSGNDKSKSRFQRCK